MAGNEVVPYANRGMSTFDVLPPAVLLAEKLARTEFVPTALRGKPDSITACILAGHELEISPLQALNKIHVIEGRPGPSAELMRAIVQRAGHQLWFEETSTTRVTIVGRRLGEEHTTKVTWTADDVKRAGLAGRPNHQKYPRAMLAARATGELVRMTFADVMAGFSYTSEELEDGFDFEEPADLPPDTTPPSGPPPITRKAAGAKRPARKAAKKAPAMAAPPPGPPLPGEEDDEIVDAELVEEEAPPVDNSLGTGKRAQQIAMRADELDIDRHELISAVTGGRKTSGKELDRAESDLVLEALRQLKVGEKRLDDVDGAPALLDPDSGFAPSDEEEKPESSQVDDPDGFGREHTWDADRWRTFLRSKGVKVTEALIEAKRIAKDIGGDEPEPTSLDSLQGRESLALLVRAFVEERAEEDEAT